MEMLMPFINRTHSIVIDAFILFFSPLRGHVVNIEKIHSEKNFSDDEVLVPIKYLKILNEAACYNQGSFTQYWYLASLKHKKLRLEWNKKEKNKDTLNYLSMELMKFLNAEFHRAALNNFKIMHKYYEGRSKIAPRISIKGYFKTGDNDTVITVFRDRDVGYETETLISTNTGFEYVHKKGKYYLCNNLMKEAIRGKYINPRVDHRKVKKNYLKNIFRPKSLWKKCWNNLQEDDAGSFYSSTLIVPMIFLNNSLSEDFLDALEILPDKKRTIFGFLCIDHQDINYFKEEADVSVMYNFADALSQYLFSRLVYTDISKTQYKLKEYLFDSKMEIDIGEVNRIPEVNIIPEGYLPPYLSSNFRSISELDESSEQENYTYNLDEYLLKYVDKLREIRI